MATMNYEQKYEEALERAKQVWKYSSDLAEIKRMEGIFPELVESEDKRIKNCIEMCLAAADKQWFEDYNTTLRDCLDWLEKQGEQKSIWHNEDDEKNLQGIINAIKEVRCQSLLSEIEIYDDYIDWLKSLKERYTWKPNEEQMYMLEWLTTNVLDDGVVGNKAKEVLNTLIEQLKSL